MRDLIKSGPGMLKYAVVFNKLVGSNKREGQTFQNILIKEYALIREQGKNFIKA